MEWGTACSVNHSNPCIYANEHWRFHQLDGNVDRGKIVLYERISPPFYLFIKVLLNDGLNISEGTLLILFVAVQEFSIPYHIQDDVIPLNVVILALTFLE